MEYLGFMFTIRWDNYTAMVNLGMAAIRRLNTAQRRLKQSYTPKRIHHKIKFEPYIPLHYIYRELKKDNGKFKRVYRGFNIKRTAS
tara:strand:- start:1144 stop:1401 length:258 start_codon:yes stop_codon:yes gene_type:complete